MELSKSIRFDIVMTVIDFISKKVHFVLTHTMITIQSGMRLFLYQVWKLHSLPTHIVLDQGLQFVVLFTKELYYLLGIEIAFSIAWYSQIIDK